MFHTRAPLPRGFFGRLDSKSLMRSDPVPEAGLHLMESKSMDRSADELAIEAEHGPKNVRLQPIIIVRDATL